MAEPTGTLGLVTEADVRAAMAAVDVVVDVLALQLPGAKLLELRGALAAFAADVRWAGYSEGKVVGRQLLAREVQELILDGLL